MTDRPDEPLVERIELRPGYEIARLINGGWQLAEGHSTEGAARSASRSALLDQLQRRVDAGCTTFDCADIYTGVEELFGDLVRRHLARGGAREEIQIHTKFVPDLGTLATLDAAQIEAVIDRSLRRLGVDVLDLVQFHWWDYGVPGWVEAAGHLDALRAKGKIRHLGVTNFDRAHLEPILDAGIEIVCHQCQYSLLDRRPAADLADLCARHDIHLLSYGTLAGGFLSERWLGAEAPSEVENRSLVKYLLIVEELGGWECFQKLLRALDLVARRHEVSMATVAVRWALDQRGVAGAIVGTRSDRHLAAHRDVFRTCLDDDDHAALDRAVADAPGPSGPVFGLERIPGGRHQVIMKTGLNRMPG